TAGRARHRRGLQLPHAFPGDQPRRHRPARPAVLRLADRVLPDRQRDRHRHEEVGLKAMAAKTRSKRGLVSFGGLVLVLILFVAVNVAGNTLLRGVQPFDLTQERLFTLSPGTRQVLSQITEPITLRFYYSD